MTPTADLHLHTSASDGRLNPAELVELAAARGLKVIAITDHDSTAGIDAAFEAAKAFPSLTVIPGVEINTDIPHGEVHILGYFIDYHQPDLQRTLATLRGARLDRAKKMVAKLEGLGISIEWERVLQLAKGGAVGRPHIAQAMYEKGYVSSFQEAFDRYLGRNGPVYVERYRLTPLEAVELVVQVKGLPVLAHPAELADLEDLLTQFQKAGLVGLEAYYNGYPIQTVRELVALANKHGLIASGGSDFHGNENDAPLGSVYVPLNAAQQLIALAKRRQEVAAE
ncbi:MAG: hypothetical protein A2Y60_04190 [Chloroflexi bacterium RBG_13_54_9]|nr:MAG: hypothetical protein A2Y60_04190 [Chloroflexi bacterium RBG_13_54_9]